MHLWLIAIYFFFKSRLNLQGRLDLKVLGPTKNEMLLLLVLYIWLHKEFMSVCLSVWKNPHILVKELTHPCYAHDIVCVLVGSNFLYKLQLLSFSSDTIR
jgi:hypothetical protein